MALSAGLLHRSANDRRVDRVRHRFKSGPFPLGAARFRLIHAITDLGLYAERIAARLREERTRAQLRDAHRLVRLRDEELAGQIRAARRRARLHAEERAALRMEAQRFLRLLEEELAFQAMTESQKAADRLEDQVASWLLADDADAEHQAGSARGSP